MPDWLGKKTNWNDLRRISTGLAVVGMGTGHSPVTLSASAELTMTIGEADEPQELTMDVQNAFTGWFGPITAACTDIPTFRAITASDLTAASVISLAPVAQGDLIIADATPDWSIRTLGAAAGYALITTATTAEWDQTPAWTGDHTWDDGAGDSPHLVLKPQNHDPIHIYAADGENSALLYIELIDHAGLSELMLFDDVPAVVWRVNSDGEMTVSGDTELQQRCAIGDAASVSASDTLIVDDFVSSTTGTYRGILSIQQGDCGAGFSTTFIGVEGLARPHTAQAQSSGYFAGVVGTAEVTNTIAASVSEIEGGRFTVDVEDAAASSAHGVLAVSPAVDAGTLTTGDGIYISQGVVGAGDIATLCGLRIANIDEGTTSYSIHTSDGDVHLGDDTEIDGVLTLQQQAEPSDPSEGTGVLWLSNGTGAGDAGDLMWKSTESAVTKTETLVDFSAI